MWEEVGRKAKFWKESEGESELRRREGERKKGQKERAWGEREIESAAGLKHIP